MLFDSYIRRTRWLQQNQAAILLNMYGEALSAARSTSKSVRGHGEKMSMLDIGAMAGTVKHIAPPGGH